MKTQTKQTGKIDWERAKGFTREIYPNLKSGLSSAFNYLNTLEPCLLQEDFPPLMTLMFEGKGKAKADIGPLSQEQERELKRNQEKISKIIGEIAEKNNLNVISGLTGRKTRGVPNYISGMGFYTFKPKYEEFRIK